MHIHHFIKRLVMTESADEKHINNHNLAML